MLGALALASAGDQPLYRTPGAPIPARVADLVGRMTIEEKVAQLILPFGAHYPQDYHAFNVTGLGATYPLSGGVTSRNDWQRWQTENTRLGIPTSFIAETLHSGASGGTIFPHESLQGCTWDPSFAERAGDVIAFEAAAGGIDRGFSPVLHMCTDPRFGRCEEAFGEDPALVSAFGMAAVTGLAGAGGVGAADTYMSSPTTKICTEAKHFAAYGYGGRDGSMPAEISEHTLYDVYLKPWRAYARAGGRGIMAVRSARSPLCAPASTGASDALRSPPA